MRSAWEAATDFYGWALENGDPRTDPWLLVYSPVPLILILTVYLVLVALGPRLMDKREAFTLRSVLFIYNMALVGLSAYMFYELLVTSVLAGYSYRCQPVDYSNSQLGLRMAHVCWWYFFSKLIELLDTIFFILRKKFNQISFLHVFHHSTIIFYSWAMVKYVAGGQVFFIGMLNSFVHIFMYLYYGLAVLGPKMQKYLWWKRYLTVLQLTQLGSIALHSGYNLVTDCPFPDKFNAAVFAYMFSLIILFLNFYYQTYLHRPRDKIL